MIEIFAPRGGHVYHMCDFWENTVIRAMRICFWKKAGSHCLADCAFGVDSQTFRDVGDFWRRQAAINCGTGCFRRQAAIDSKLCFFEKRSGHLSSYYTFLEMYTTNVRIRSKSREEVEESFYTNRLAPAAS